MAHAKKHTSDLVRMNAKQITNQTLGQNVPTSSPPYHSIFFPNRIYPILIFSTDTEHAIYYVKLKNAYGNTGFIAVVFSSLNCFEHLCIGRKLEVGWIQKPWVDTFRNYKAATRKPFSCKSADFYVKLGWLIIAYNLH